MAQDTQTPNSNSDKAAQEPLDIFAAPPAGAPPLPTAESKFPQPAPVEANSEPVDLISKSATNDIVIEPAKLDTPESDAAIDDIVAQEADQVLAAEDAGVQLAEETAEVSEEPGHHGHPVFWFIIFLLVIVAVLSAYVVTNPGLELPFGL